MLQRSSSNPEAAFICTPLQTHNITYNLQNYGKKDTRGEHWRGGSYAYTDIQYVFLKYSAND